MAARLVARTRKIKSKSRSPREKVWRRAYQASGDLTKAAATLENALLVARDSTVFGMLGDVYTDMGELAKAGEMYDKCLEAMD